MPKTTGNTKKAEVGNIINRGNFLLRNIPR
jgi:hypothetical protein